MSRAGTGSTTTTTSEGKRARAFAELCGGASFSRGAMRGMGRAGGTRGSDGDGGVGLGGGGDARARLGRVRRGGGGEEEEEEEEARDDEERRARAGRGDVFVVASDG